MVIGSACRFAGLACGCAYVSRYTCTHAVFRGRAHLCPLRWLADPTESGLLRSILFYGRGETTLEQLKRIRGIKSRVGRARWRERLAGKGVRSVDAPVEQIRKLDLSKTIEVSDKRRGEKVSVTFPDSCSVRLPDAWARGRLEAN